MTNMHKGKVALVTGGAQGMGFAAAKRFLDGGFDGVMLLDRNGARLRESAAALRGKGRVETIEGDLLDLGLPARAMAAVKGAFDRLDVLVNAAGNTERCGIDDTTPASFDRLFGVNVKAPLFMMQEAIRLMRPQGHGTIINISSMLAHGGPPNLVTYSASKAALVTLTRATANAVKREGIRIFAVNLGWVHSEGEQALQTGFHGLPENWHEEIGRRMPSGRLIVPDDVAGLLAYLVTPSAQMMTGAVIDYEQMPTGVFDSGVTAVSTFL
jgi:NAD(P)-dependent dehydrogenase (short-subunit alcohol dehydrogenase family)